MCAALSSTIRSLPSYFRLVDTRMFSDLSVCTFPHDPSNGGLDINVSSNT